MSWMDSWSRPNKQQATPAPFYLLPGGDGIPYCKSCGRVISSRKSAISINNNNNNNNNKPNSSSSGNTKRTKGKRKVDRHLDPPPQDQEEGQQDERSDGSKKGGNNNGSDARYCSSRCRSHKPGKLDRDIEDTFARFLTGEDKIPEDACTEAHAQGGGKLKKKGDTRILVPCDVVEEHAFGERRRAAAGNKVDKTFGRKKNRASRVIQPSDTNDVDDVQGHRREAVIDSDLDIELEGEEAEIDPDVLARLSIRSGSRIRPPQTVSEVNGSVGGEKGWAERIVETEEMKEKRIEGQRKSHEKEMVRAAARRGVVFGFAVRGEGGRGMERRKCEAVAAGQVVEPSFAKGAWGVRWRE